MKTATNPAQSTETFRARIYGGDPMTMDRAMGYAVSGGLSGETIRAWPAAYLATHIVPEGGVYPMGEATARAVAGLLKKGWIERTEKTVEVPADTDRFSMFAGQPAHSVTLATYHATAKGRAAWTKRAA